MFYSRYLRILTGVFLVLISFTLTEARIDTLEVHITSADFFFNHDSTQSRCILNFPLPEQLRGKELVLAELFMPINFDASNQPALDLFCHPLLSEVGPEYIPESDSIPWNLLSEQGAHFVTSTVGEQVAYFDMTRQMESWRNGDIANNGLFLFTGAENRTIVRFHPIDGQIVAKMVIFCEH